MADNKKLAILVCERLSLRDSEKIHSWFFPRKFWNIIALRTEIVSNIITFVEYLPNSYHFGGDKVTQFDRIQVCTARLTIANSVATQPEGSATLISTPAA
jgi:hypothetical protein